MAVSPSALKELKVQVEWSSMEEVKAGHTSAWTWLKGKKGEKTRRVLGKRRETVEAD